MNKNKIDASEPSEKEKGEIRLIRAQGLDKAVEELYSENKNNPELTIFTVLGGEEFTHLS